VTPPTDLLLPEGARLVHIGPHKTGSTAIQVALKHAGAELERHGAFYATGVGHRPDKAGWALGLRGRPYGAPQPPMERWESLARKVAAAGERRVCISNEDFGRADDDQVRRIVDDLGGDRVHVVAVARRLDRYLPSQWQERVKAGERRSFEEWLEVVLDLEAPEFDWHRFNVWHAHDLEQLISRWTKVVGQDRFTLVVGDDQDRELLPRTFEDLLGLPRGLLRPDPSRSNRGLTWAETEMVRALNELVEQAGWSREQRRRYVRYGLLTELQSRPAPDGPKAAPFPDWALERVRALSEQRVRQIRDSGVRLVGAPKGMRVPDHVVAAGSSLPESLPDLDVRVAAVAILSVMRVAIGEDSGQDSEQGSGTPHDSTGQDQRAEQEPAAGPGD